MCKEKYTETGKGILDFFSKESKEEIEAVICTDCDGYGCDKCNELGYIEI